MNNTPEKVIDRNNWYMGFRSLSNTQLITVCEVLVKEFEQGHYGVEINKTTSVGVVGKPFRGNLDTPWKYIGVINACYTRECYLDRVTFKSDTQEITYQQFEEEFLQQGENKMSSAERTLHELGYQDCGGELWKPPIGDIPEQIIKEETYMKYEDFKTGQVVMVVVYPAVGHLNDAFINTPVTVWGLDSDGDVVVKKENKARKQYLNEIRIKEGEAKVKLIKDVPATKQEPDLNTLANQIKEAK